MSFSERIYAVADGMLSLPEGIAPSMPSVDFVTVKDGKRLFDETIAFSAGAQVLLGDGSEGSIYGRPGAAIARRVDGTVVAAKDVVDLMSGEGQRNLVSDGTIDAGAARGLALNAIDIRGEFLPFERLDENQNVVARGLVNTEGFRGVWEIQQLQAGGHRLRLVERGGRLIEAGLFPTEIAATTAAFQVDVRARARDAGNPDWMRAANLYQLVQSENGVLARVAFGAELNGRTGVVAERADTDLAAAQVVAQESAVAATLKASVAPELDVKTHLADFQRTVDTALGRAQPVSNAPRNAASKVVDFVARHPVLAGAAGAAVAGAAAVAARLALSAGNPPPAPRAWIEADGDALSLSRVGQALAKIEGIKVRSITHAEPARIEIEFDRADPATGLAAAVRIKDVSALRFADATLPDFLPDGDRSAARERFALDIAAAFDQRHALRWSGDGYTAEHPASSYQLVAAQRTGATLEDLYEPVAAANQRKAAFGTGMSLTDGVPVPLDFAQQAVRQHASGVLQWSAGQDGSRVAPLGFAGSYELRPVAQGVEALYARRSGAPEQRQGEPIAFSLGLYPDADTAAQAAQGHNDAVRDAARADREKRPLGQRRDGPQAIAGDARYVLVPVENRSSQYDVYRIEPGLAPLRVTRARDELDARERLASAGRNADALRVLTPEEIRAWRMDARDRVDDEIRTTSRRVAASAGLDLLVRVVSDVNEIDARVRNLEASRMASQTAFLDVPDGDRLKAVAAGAKIDPASGALFIPEDAAPELREALTSEWPEHEEVARNRVWIDVPNAEHDVAVALGAQFDGVAKRFYIPEGIEPALEAGLRDVFQTDRAQKAVDAERAAQDQGLTAAFSAGAESLAEAGIEPAIDTRAFARSVQMKTAGRGAGAMPAPMAAAPAKSKANDQDKTSRPLPSQGDKHQPTGRSIADELVAVAASAITAAKGAATNGADLYRRVSDHEARKRAESAKAANTGPGAHFEQDVVSSSTPAGLASPAPEASAAPVRASAGATAAENRPTASVDLVIAAPVGMPEVAAKRELAQRVKALGNDHLKIAHELTANAYADSLDSLRRHATATGAAKVAAFKTGLDAIQGEAAARGLTLPVAQAPAAPTAARPRSRAEDN
ncbi:MAG: hypothetical protein IBJ15_20950, partial [Alphaproteobacteria bacterium]|nr:hypothetical protein [Alphaproteobacteria bacterium]